MQLTSLQLSFDGYGWVRMKDGIFLPLLIEQARGNCLGARE
jgi:hypothetical protein